VPAVKQRQRHDSASQRAFEISRVPSSRPEQRQLPSRLRIRVSQAPGRQRDCRPSCASRVVAHLRRTRQQPERALPLHLNALAVSATASPNVRDQPVLYHDAYSLSPGAACASSATAPERASKPVRHGLQHTSSASHATITAATPAHDDEHTSSTTEQPAQRTSVTANYILEQRSKLPTSATAWWPSTVQSRRMVYLQSVPAERRIDICDVHSRQ
jgi:hypothetical protein